MVAARHLAGYGKKRAPFWRLLHDRWGGPDESTYGRWEDAKDDVTVPAWALLAVAEIAGVQLGDLFSAGAPRPVLDRMDGVESSLERVLQRLDRMEAHLLPDREEPA